MYCKISIVAMDNLPEAQQDRLMALCDTNPDGFIAISEGDETYPSFLDFEDVFQSTEALLASVAGSRVYVVTDNEDAALESEMISKVKGYFAGEITYIV